MTTNKKCNAIADMGYLLSAFLWAHEDRSPALVVGALIGVISAASYLLVVRPTDHHVGPGGDV